MLSTSLGMQGGSGTFKEPLMPRRISKTVILFPDPDFFYEGGFKTVSPSTGLLDLGVLSSDFIEQMTLQDKRTIDIARGKYRLKTTSTTTIQTHSRPVVNKNSGVVEPQNIASTPVWGKHSVSSATKGGGGGGGAAITALSHRDPRVQRRQRFAYTYTFVLYFHLRYLTKMSRY